MIFSKYRFVSLLLFILFFTINNRGAAQTNTLNSPLSSSSNVDIINFEYTLSETPQKVQVFFICTDGPCLTSGQLRDTLTITNNLQHQFFVITESNLTGNSFFTSNQTQLYNGYYSVYTQLKRVTTGDTINSLISTNVYLDHSTNAPTLITPSSNTSLSTQIPISLTLGEIPASGTSKLTFTNTAGSYSNTLVLANGTLSQTFTLTSNSLATSGSIASSTFPTLPNDSYNITLSYQDIFNHPAVTATNSNVLIQSSTPIPNLTSPSTGAVFSSNNSPTFTYNLPSAPLSGTAFLSLTSSTGSSYVYTLPNQAGSGTYTITSNIPADGTYTATVSYQDFLSNPVSSTSVSNLIFDHITQLPTINLPIANSIIAGTSTITYTIPEAHLSGTKQLKISQNGTTITTLVLSDVNTSTLSLNFKNLIISSSTITSITGSSNIPDGTYSLTFSYQDQYSNPVAFSTINFTIKARINVNYVDSASGSDLTGYGSYATPYKTIQKAIDASLAGDTVLVKAGTYKEQLSITKGITLESTDGAAKTIISQEALLDRNINIDNEFASPYLQVNIKGFKFLNAKLNRGYGIVVEKKSFAKIESCYFEGFNIALKTYYGYYNVRNSIFYDNDVVAGNDVGDNDVFPIFQNCTIVNSTQILSSSTSVIHRIYNSIFVNDKSKNYNSTPFGSGTRVPMYNVIVDTLLKDYNPADGSKLFIVNRAEDMRFTSLTSKDFSLSNSSPAIGLGNTTLNDTIDYIGASRPNPVSSKPDLGAYENSNDHASPFLTDSSNSTQIKIFDYQYPTTGLSKTYVYKGLSVNPTTKYDSIGVVNSYTDTSNKIYNKYLYYRFTSIGVGFNESGYSNEIKTILFSKPTLLLPSNNTFSNDTSIKFIWTKNENALQYKLQYATDSTFSNNVVQKSVNDTSVIVTGLKTNTNYYWRVLATDTIYSGPWSSLNKMQTFVAKPLLDSAKSIYKNLNLYWTNKDTAYTKYVKIYRDSLGVTSKLIDSIAGNQLSYKDTKNLILNQKYYYRIKFGNYDNIESDTSNIISAIPVNTLPKATRLLNKSYQNVGEYNFVKLDFSANGSYDLDGTITSYNWFVNDSLVNKTDTLFSYFFKLGTNTVKLIVIDNDGGKDSSIAIANLSTLQKKLQAGILGGISAINQNYILTADTSYNNITGSSVLLLDRSGNTILPIVVQSKIFTTPSISSDSSILITNGSSLNGYSKAGVSLWPTIPLGGISYVTPTIDSNLGRIYVGVSNKNFFAYDYKSGKNIWSVICDAPINTSAVITGDRKLIFTSQSGTLYGFDISKADVQTAPKWKMSFGDIITKSPSVDASSNIYVGTDAGRLIKFQLNTDGTVSVKWNVTLSSSVQTSPVIDADSNVYVGTENGYFYKIDRSNGNTIWSYNVGAAIHSTPNISEFGTIYVANMNGLVTAITTDKIVLWKYQDVAAISANSLYINNMLYVASEKGTFTGIYDNPNSVNINTSITGINNSQQHNFGSLASVYNFILTPELEYYANVYKNSNINIANTSIALVAKKPVWGTFQGDYRRTGSLSLICPTTISISRDSTGSLISSNQYIQWYKDAAPIQNAANISYKPATAGSYFVKNNQLGCNTITSNSYYYIVTDLINISNDEFIKVNPNPISNIVSFDFNVKGYQYFNLEIFNLETGNKITSHQNVYSGQHLSFGSLSSGVYLFTLTTLDNKFNYQFKMVKL